MFKHYLTAAIRLIKRSVLFSTINMLGFILGITAAFLIYLWIVDEMTFEDFQQNRDSIYRVVEVSVGPSGEIKEKPSAATPLANVFRKDFPSVENATFVISESKRAMEYNNNLIEGDVIYVDSCFFDMFTFPVVEGNPSQMKDVLHGIVLSDETAKKLFGNSPAVGNKIFHSYFDSNIYFTVVGVIKVPRKSHLRFDMAIDAESYGMPLSWNYSSGAFVYIQMNPDKPASYDQRLAMSKVLNKYTDTKSALSFQPLTDIHLRTRFSDPEVRNHGNMSQIYLFIALAILIIFMGAFNFTTLSSAQSSLRYKEIGVRKVTGAKQKTLITQFLSESTVQAFISLILALMLTELMLPLFNRIVDKDISLTLNWQIFLFVILGVFIVGCLAGSYPAFYLSSVNPLRAFKGGQKTGKKGTFIKALVCVQFVIAITLIVCTSVMFKQLDYMQNQDLGYEKENIISVNTNLWYNVADFKQEILKNPNVKSVTMGAQISDYLKGYSYEGSVMEWDTPDGSIDSIRFVNMWADGDFFEVFNIELLKGEFFVTDWDSYWSGNYEFPALINETAWKQMRVDNPIGMPVRDVSKAYNRGVIVGVVKDFNFQPLREKIQPLIIRYSPESLVWIHIRMAPGNQQETIKFLQEKFNEMRPPIGKVFNYKFMTDELNRNYASEQQQSRILLIFTILAIIIAMMGVFGLVSLSTQQRTKEIGVRKVNGAHSDRIVRMFCYEYLRWLVIAFVIACPLAFLIMNNWLNGFAYRTSLSWWLFPLAGIIIFIITMITVIAQTYRTASQNPITSLRYE